MVEQRKAERPKTYAEIKATLGEVIPCYSVTGGCHADDQDGVLCDDGCIMFRIWNHGYDAARAALNQEESNAG